MKTPIERQIAKDELKRINTFLSHPHILIGGLAVQQYVTHRVSKDIDLICSFDTSSKIIKTLYPTLHWSVYEPNDNDYRPSYRIRHRSKEGYGEIIFGPKILERGPYEDMDWSILATNAKPFAYRGEEVFENILVPTPHVLAFTKLISFLTRRGTEQKVLQDLDDFIDLSNSNQFAPSELFNLIDATNHCNRIMYDFRLKLLTHKKQLENSCLYQLSFLFHDSDSQSLLDSIPFDGEFAGRFRGLIRKIRESTLVNSDLISIEMESFLRTSAFDAEVAAIRAKRCCLLIIYSLFSATLDNADLGLDHDMLVEKMLESNLLSRDIHLQLCIVRDMADSIDRLSKGRFRSLGKSDNSSLKDAIFEIGSFYLYHKPNQAPTSEADKTFIVKDLDVSLDDVMETLDIDVYAYSGPYLRYAGTKEAVTRWFFLEPRIYTLLKHKSTGRVVGYINAIPVANEVFGLIETGDFDEMSLGASEIRPFDMPGTYRLYLCSIAISNDFSNIGNLKKLVDGFLNKIPRLANDDIFVQDIIADAVTNPGIRMCEQFGFRRVSLTSRKTPIYEVKMLPPEFKVVTEQGSALRKQCMLIHQRLDSMI